MLARTSARAFDAPARLSLRTERWSRLCGVRRRTIRLAGSPEIAVPVAVGPLRPSILIPASLLDELDEAELDQIGLHETAHLARGDDYALLVQRILEALFALHPVVRWIARRIDLEREIACDDRVIAATGRPHSYATCLTRVVELSGGVRSSLAAATAADDLSHLSRRVDMLLDKTRHTGTQLLKARLTAMVVLVAALAWIAGRSPGFVAFASPLVHKAAQAVPMLFAPAIAAPAPQPAPQGAQGFDARVIEDSSGNPLASAELRFHKAGLRELAADLDSDREGIVRTTGLAPGDYTLEVMKPNYVTTSLKVRVPIAGLVVRMLRYGIISGAVTDQQGQPVPGTIHAPYGRAIGGTRVAVLMKSEGSEQLKSVREVPLEDGRYRVHDLPPGQYALGVWYDGLKDGSGVQLYPDNARPRFFNISGGEEIDHIDFLIVPRGSYRVAGKVQVPKKGDQYALALGLPDQPALPVAQALTEGEGAFHFDKIPIGTYDLFVGGPSRGYGARTTLLGPEPMYARMRIQVTGQNIEGLDIPLTEPRSLAVSLKARGGGALPEGCPQSAPVYAEALDPWGLVFPGSGSAQVAFGKEQTLKGLAPGLFRVSLRELGNSCYLVNSPAVDLSGEAAGPVALEVAPAGSIRGTLRAGSASPKDFAVVLLDSGASADAPSQLAFPDDQGRFTFGGLHPGRYRIAAQPAAAAKSRWVPDVSRMTEIDIQAGSPTDLDLPVAPKGGRQ
jgi:hypothetical protein